MLNGPDGLSLPPVDAVVSNPPYICTGELPGLQKEVRQEPRLALDGGPDGLSFYRAITNNWLGLLKPGGVAAVEIGNGQENAVADLLKTAGVSQITFSQDITGAIRVVIGNKNVCL